MMDRDKFLDILLGLTEELKEVNKHIYVLKHFEVLKRINEIEFRCSDNNNVGFHAEFDFMQLEDNKLFEHFKAYAKEKIVNLSEKKKSLEDEIIEHFKNLSIKFYGIPVTSDEMMSVDYIQSLK